MNKSVLIQKIMNIGQLLEKEQIEYSGAESMIRDLLDEHYSNNEYKPKNEPKKLPLLITVGGKNVPRERVIAFWKETHRVFPYITFHNCWTFKKEFPFIRKFSSPVWGRKELCCLAIQLDNGKIVRQWFKHGSYSSHTYCEQGLASFIRNNYPTN